MSSPEAYFSFKLTGLSAGNYILSLYSEDVKGNRSSLASFPVNIISGTITNVSNIFIAPTISTDQVEVKQGDEITFFGQSTPNSQVNITVNSETPHLFSTPADNTGVYLYNLKTDILEIGEHFAKARALIANEMSGYGRAVSFFVKTEPGEETIKDACELNIGDLNCDTRINLVDYSILAFWYKRPSPPLKVDLNKDGKVDLIDFSILAFYWTG